jgi:hypothetical protein
MSFCPHLAALALAALWAAPPALCRDLAELDLGLRDSDYEPSITLKEHENRRMEEYRVNNNLYLIKVSPAAGAPYYLVDEDGSGDMAMSRGSDGIEQSVPQWALLSW